MAKISIFNIGKANALIDATSAVLAPALAKAGITTIAFDGKTVPASDAPLNEQVSSLLAAQPAVEGAQSAAQALESNEVISAELDKTKVELAQKTVSVEALSKSNTDLQSKLSTATATVQDLTAKNGVITTERDAAVKQFNANADQLKLQKSALASRCLAANCLDLSALPKEATEADKISAAEKISFDDLFKAYNGAVNAAVAKTGVSFAAIPAAGSPAGAGAKEVKTGRARFNSGVSVKQ